MWACHDVQPKGTHILSFHNFHCLLNFTGLWEDLINLVTGPYQEFDVWFYISKTVFQARLWMFLESQFLIGQGGLTQMQHDQRQKISYRQNNFLVNKWNDSLTLTGQPEWLLVQLLGLYQIYRCAKRALKSLLISTVQLSMMDNFSCFVDCNSLALIFQTNGMDKMLPVFFLLCVCVMQRWDSILRVRLPQSVRHQVRDLQKIHQWKSARGKIYQYCRRFCVN